MSTRYSSFKRWRALMLLRTGLMLVAIGCSTPQERYKLLSLVFDGVPDPDAALKRASHIRKTASGQTVYVHKPFADQKCDSCHLNTSDIFARAKVSPDICSKCHSDIQSEHKIIHGPVAVNMCLTCHSPHHSIQPHLLKSAVPKLCTQCHEQDTLTTAVPEHLDPKSSCITCHSGHGGDDRRFLKVASATTRPTPQPTTRPAGGSGVNR